MIDWFLFEFNDIQELLVIVDNYFNKAISKLFKYRSLYRLHPNTAAIKLIWWNFRYLLSVKSKSSSFKDEKEHIVIELKGGIGDFLFAAKYIEALYRYISVDCVIDIISDDANLNAIKSIFFGKDYINKIYSGRGYKTYDLHISIVRFPIVISYDINRLNSQTIQYIQMLEKFYSDNLDIVENDYLGRCWSKIMGHTRENMADIGDVLHMSDFDFELKLESDEDEVLNKYGLQKSKFITFQTGSGIHFQHIRVDTRQWPIEFYEELVSFLKKNYPQYKLIQIGRDYQIQCVNVHLDLREKTTIEDFFVILKNAKLHFSQEGGMPIIRHYLLGGKSVVLFGPTDKDFYGFSENINVSANVCHSCEWLNSMWYQNCMLTGDYSLCMKKLTPQIVIKVIEQENLL